MNFRRFPIADLCRPAVLSGRTRPCGSPDRRRGACDFQHGGSRLGGATKEVQIVDPYFNMVAYTMTIPAAWNFQGAVMTDRAAIWTSRWSPTVFGATIYATGCSACRSSPGIRSRIQGRCWGRSAKKMPALTATDYGNKVIPTLRPGAQIVSVNTAPQAAGLVESNKQMEAVLAANADRLRQPHPRFSSDAQQFRVQYAMGKDPEEEFLQVMEQVSEMPASTMVSRPGQVLRTQWTMTRKTEAWIVAERAPKGQLDAAARQLEVIRMSLKENPEWDKKIGEWIRDRGNAQIRQSWAITNASLKASAQQHDALMARGQAFNDNMRAQGDRRNAEFARAQDAKSRHTADEVDHILDQQYYVNPSNGQKKSTISTTYSNNWQNGAGEQVLTNIQGYDPNGQVQGNWTQLQPIKH